MKRTDRLTIIIALLLFLAFAAYAASYAYKALSDQTVTAEAAATSVSADGTASGIIIRSETILSSSESYIDVSVSDGTKVAAGGTLAMAMSSETGLERSNRMHELELEIARASALLGGIRSSDDLTARDANMRSAVLSLTLSVARGDFSSLDMAAVNLSSLVLDSGDSVTEQDLLRLQAELSSLKNSSSADTTQLLAQESGIFSSYVDGWEGLTPRDISALTPSKLQQLISSRAEVPQNVYGKLITEYYWYFAAVMSSADASNLSVGGYASLDFGKYLGESISAKVMSISQQEQGECAVVFRCDRALSDTLSMRQVSAQVIFEEYDGIRVPTQAICTDPESESTYVWVITAMQLERKDVEIIYCGDSFCIVKRSSDANALREGNTIVVSGKDLYEGKLME